MNRPCVIRDTAMGAFRSSLEDEAFARREIELEGAIDRAKAMDTIRAMRFLAEENSEKPITLLINSEGGSVVDGLAIYDTLLSNLLYRIARTGFLIARQK